MLKTMEEISLEKYEKDYVHMNKNNLIIIYYWFYKIGILIEHEEYIKPNKN